ncbi:conserved exported hypothetical protein [Syntrophobacter sp. SbD1]|nr:conserved exported hypothetical protein [Syntrophobacter sp. SbD1]
MIRKKLFSGLCLVVTLFLLATCPARAQESSAESSNPGEDARALLNRTADFLSKAGQFSVTIRSGYDAVQASGQKIEFGEIRKVTLRRPDRFRSDIERSDGQKGLAIFDGKDIIIYNEKDKVYAKASSPGDLDGAVTYLLKDLGMRLPLAMMFVSRLPLEIENRVRSVETVEQTAIMDVPCVQLAARTDDVDFQIWVPSKGDPLPRRIVITYKHDKGQPQFRANLSDWNLSPNPSDQLFVFSPPEDARQIPFLAQIASSVPEPAKKKLQTKKGGNQ